MNIINIEHISKILAERFLMTFPVAFPKEKIGVIGINGTGKLRVCLPDWNSQMKGR